MASQPGLSLSLTFKLPLVVNAFRHTVHRNGLSPVCVRMCIWSADDDEKFLWHTLHKCLGEAVPGRRDAISEKPAMRARRAVYLLGVLLGAGAPASGSGAERFGGDDDDDGGDDSLSVAAAADDDFLEPDPELYCCCCI